MTDGAGRDGIAGRQGHLRQVSRIARVFRCKHFHQSLRIHRIRQSSDICAVGQEIKKKDLSNLHESPFGDDKFVDHVNGDARQRDGCEYPTDFDGPSRVRVILCVQRDRIDQSAYEN